MRFLKKLSRHYYRGDTLIEVSFAIAIFSLVSVISIALMNSGTVIAENSLEITMARNEIDAQSEAIRFIHNSYLSEKNLTTSEQKYKKLWDAIVARAINPNAGIDNLPANLAIDNNPPSCSVAYNGTTTLFTLKSFVVNTRNINPSDANATVVPASTSVFKEPTLNPRIIFKRSGGEDQGDLVYEQNTSSQNNSIRNYYNKVARVEGIWDIAVKSDNTNNPQFYDFHIRTCWYGPGQVTPSTIATIIRLYNPDYTAS